MISKLKSTGKQLSSLVGLVVINKLMQQSSIKAAIKESIPQQIKRRERHISKFKNLILGFAAGAECLDDMTTISLDPIFKELADKTYHPKSYGDFLRAFSGEDLWKLQTSLIEFA